MKKAVAAKRVPAFDLARGLAILFMVSIHVLNFYATPTVRQGAFGEAVQLLFGWPAGSLFIFIMGVFVAYSKSSLSLGLKRATLLFIAGYALNFMRSTLPTWLSLKFGLVTYEQLGVHTPIYELFIVDILQCAALSYAICCLLRHYFPQKIVWLAVAGCVAFGSHFFWGAYTGYPVFDQVLKIFWGGKAEGSLFPLFPWLAYPLVGMAFGQWMQQHSNIHRAFQQALLVGIVLIVVGTLLILSNPVFHLADNLRSGPGLIVLLNGAVFIWLWLCHFIVNKIPLNTETNLLFFWSKNITIMYAAHFMYIGWGLMIFGAEQMNLAATIAMIVGVTVLADLTTRIWLRLMQLRASPKQVMSQSKPKA